MKTKINESYSGLIKELASLLEGELDPIANAANMSALLYARLDDVNWVGFYFRQGNELVLGPFQGKPACVRITVGKGVCGTAALHQRTVVVPDVHQFPGHITCDAASNSEAVVPVLCQGQVVGVLDIDSPVLDRFDATDGRWLEQAVEVFCRSSNLEWLRS